MSKLSRRSFLFAAGASVVALGFPAPAYASSPGSVAERTIAHALNSAALRQKFTPKETWDIATKLGVSLETAAPRATPWLKLIAKASPIGRAITIVGAVALAYDVVTDMWNAAPTKTATKGTYDGSIVELCPQGQVCKYTDQTGTFSIFQTRETSPSQSNWTHAGQYPVLKSVSLGSTAKPYVYTVYWKVTNPQLPQIMNPIPAGPDDKKQKVAPGNLADYLDQFKEEEPSAVGLSQSINDMLEQMEASASGIKTGLRTIASDIAKAIAGIGTKLKDFFDDSPYDRPPNVGIDPTTGTPNPDPATNPNPGTGTGPGTGTNPGTGTGTGPGAGTDQCLPGAADCPAKVEWGEPPTGEAPSSPTPFSWVPTPWTAPYLPGSCSGLPYDFTVVFRGASGSINPCPVLDQARPVIRPVAITGWTVYAITQFLDL